MWMGSRKIAINNNVAEEKVLMKRMLFIAQKVAMRT